MTAGLDAHATDWPKPDPAIIREGVISGLIGAISIAVWFLIVDSIHGRPFFTPSLMGTAMITLLGGAAHLPSPESVPISFGMVLLFSCVHGAAFIGGGILGAWLLRLVDINPAYGYWIALLYVTFSFWFTFLNLLFAGVVLKALSVPDILVAHLLAAVFMGIYYWKRHPNLASQF